MLRKPPLIGVCSGILNILANIVIFEASVIVIHCIILTRRKPLNSIPICLIGPESVILDSIPTVILCSNSSLFCNCLRFVTNLIIISCLYLLISLQPSIILYHGNILSYKFIFFLVFIIVSFHFWSEWVSFSVNLQSIIFLLQTTAVIIAIRPQLIMILDIGVLIHIHLLGIKVVLLGVPEILDCLYCFADESLILRWRLRARSNDLVLCLQGTWIRKGI